MLHDGLAGAEGPGDGGGAALGHGEHGIHDALAGEKGRLGGIFVFVGAAHTDGPFLRHGEGHHVPLGGAQGGHGVQHGEGAGLDGLQGAAHLGRDHDLVEDGGGLLDGADDVAALHLVAGLGGGLEVPVLLAVQGRDLDAAGNGGAGDLHDALQGPLDAVVDIFDQAGAQLHRQGGAGGFYRRAGAQAGGLLIDLDGGGVPVHGEDLADEALLAHADHVGHVGVRKSRGDHQRAGDFYDLSAAQIYRPSFG